MTRSKYKPGPSVAEGYWSVYLDYSRTLRAWLVAYGIGGPVLFVSNQRLSEALSKSGCVTLIVSLFLLGVFFQVLLAFLNKWAAWHLFTGEDDPDFQERTDFRFWEWVSDQFWLDVALDTASILAFAASTLLVFSVLVT